MGQGFQERIDTIVSSIVYSEKEKNNKIDENDISDSIKKAISGLNDIGKILVLDDLEKEAGQTPSKLLTIDGKISIEKLNIVVENKIKDAEQEGINIKFDAKQIFKDNKILVADGIITIAAIDIMVNNFENLTSEEIDTLRNNYELLNSEQRDKYDKGMLRKIDDTDLSEPEKEELRNVFEDDFHKSINSILNTLQKRYGEDFQDKFQEVSQEEIESIIDDLQVSDVLKDELKKHRILIHIDAEKARQQRADFIIQITKAEKEGNSDEVTKLEAEIAKIEASNAYKTWQGIDNKLKLEKDGIFNTNAEDFHRSIDSILITLKNIYGEDFQEKFQEISQVEIDSIIEGLDISDGLKAELRTHKLSVLINVEKARQQRAKLIRQQYKAKKEGNIEEQEKLAEEIARIEDSDNYQIWENIYSKLQNQGVREYNSQKTEENMQQEAQENSQTAPQENENEKQNPEDIISQELQDISRTLSKENFTPEQIKESLVVYKDFLEKIDNSDIEKLNSLLGTEQLSQLFSKKFQKFGMDEKIAEILSKIDYNGQLFEILGNETKRKEFFEQLDQVIQPTKEQQLTDVDVQKGIDAGRVIADTLDASAAIEAQQKRTTEENQQNEQTQQSQETQQEPAVPPVVEENKPKEEEQLPKKDEEEKPTSAQNLPAKIGPIGLLFGGIRSILSRIKNKIFRKPEKRVQEAKTDEQDEKDSKMGDSSAEQHSDTPKKSPPSLDEQLKAGVDQSKFNKPIQQQVAPKKEEGQKTNDGEEFEQE